MFKFIASDGIGSLKRHQAPRACDSCRRRKKRCDHYAGTSSSNSSPARKSTPARDTLSQQQTKTKAANAPSNSDVASKHGNLGDTQLQSPVTATSDESHSISLDMSNLDTSDQDLEAARILSGGAQFRAIASEPQGPPVEQPRFIGDLNPESIFLAATSADTTRGVSLDSVGVWLSTKIGKKAPQPSTLQSNPSSLFSKSSALVQEVVVPLLEQECLSTMPPKASFEALSKIYFEKIHPVFPIIDEEGYHNLRPTDNCRALLQQGMCLAASKNFAAREHLILNASEPPMTCREFGEKIASTMRLSIEMGMVTSKVVMIQALVLLSQFTDSPSGEDLSSQFCGKAVYLLQSMGLHLQGQGQQDGMNTRLLCCVYAIDRMNAAFHGCPVFMHERDISKDLLQCFEQQEPGFRLLLDVILLLNKVIGVYRPLNSAGYSGLDVEFPSFEDLVVKCSSSHISMSSLATIETLYNAVSILSHRTLIWSSPARSTPSYLRQALSTSIISSLTPHDLQEQLVCFPFIPYAISLSLSITYREMRHHKLPLHRKRARAQFQQTCRLLKELEGVWWSAKNAAELGWKMLREIDRVFSAVSAGDKAGGQDSAGGETVGGDNQSGDTANTPMTTSMHQIPDFDPSVFDFGPDIDLFGMFDPAFDLEGFDAQLEGNLNLGFPMGYS
ncbi:hypothetical protein ACMFMF_002357 [Clarireedia jacksonii]